MDFREHPGALDFLRRRLDRFGVGTPLDDRKAYEMRVAQLQRLMHGTAYLLRHASPAAMQLALLQNQAIVLPDAPSAAQLVVIDQALRTASDLLLEGDAYQSGDINQFERHWPQFYLVFETRMLLALLALKPAAPLTHRGCTRIAAYIWEQEALRAQVDALNAEMLLAKQHMDAHADAVSAFTAEAAYKQATKRAIRAVVEIYTSIVDVRSYPVTNPMVDSVAADLPSLVDVPVAGSSAAEQFEVSAFD